MSTRHPRGPSRQRGRFLEKFTDRFGERSVSVALAIAIEVLLILAVLTMGSNAIGVKDGQENLTSIDFSASPPPPPAEAEPEPEPAPPEPEPEPEPVPEAQPEPEVQPEPEPEPEIVPEETPLPPPVVKTPNKTAPPPRAKPAPPPPKPAPPIPAPTTTVYGPMAPSSRSSVPDSQRVGTAPDGEPLYAAQWYRRPRDDELGGYLSTASGPGWGMIACKTAPGYRVEDCVALEEWPLGSNINRAILAAAWQFQVRPPRLGGQYLVGEWVRIRIDYNTRHSGPQ
jgi:periplasmic protein TonB